MNSDKSVIWLIVVPTTLALAASGCASKKYVRQQVAPVNQKVAATWKQTQENNEKIAATWSKLQIRPPLTTWRQAYRMPSTISWSIRQM